MEPELINGIKDVLETSMQQRSGKGVMRKLDAETMEKEKENLAAEPNLPTMKEAFPVSSDKPNIPNTSPNPPAHESTTQPERPSAGVDFTPGGPLVAGPPRPPRPPRSLPVSRGRAGSPEAIFHLLGRALNR